MEAAERRETIHQLLCQTEQPLSASALAARFGVSRQVIVGDVALLRAAGVEVSATPRGYVLRAEQSGLRRSIACRHGADQMETELNVLVDNGCTVLDVTVEHPIYGQITGPLQLSSRYDVRQFIETCRRHEAPPLSALTEGIHLHSLSCRSEEAWLRACEELRALGILLEDQ